MSAEAWPQPIELSIAIDERYHDQPTAILLPDTHPQQYKVSGTIADDQIRIGFWAFKRAKYPACPWFIALVPPANAVIDGTAQKRLVKRVQREVENFWYELDESRPDLRLLDPERPKPKRHRKKLVLALSLSLIGGKLVLSALKRRQRSPQT